MNSNKYQDLFLNKRAIQILNSVMNNRQRAPPCRFLNQEEQIMPNTFILALPPTRIFRPVIQGQKFRGTGFLADCRTKVHTSTNQKFSSYDVSRADKNVKSVKTTEAKFIVFYFYSIQDYLDCMFYVRKFVLRCKVVLHNYSTKLWLPYLFTYILPVL